MAFEIVDGMTGTKHISSDDLAALNTATVGKADCVLEYGDDFKLTMASANSATLGTGVGMVGGKRFWNQAPTSLTIQSGTQGQKRNDLIVARYSRTSEGIESIEPVVIKGAPTTGTPADPEVTANDLKLWRVPLDGINAGTPVRLTHILLPLSAAIQGVVQALYDSGWYTVYTDDNIDIRVRRFNQTVFLNGKVRNYPITTSWKAITTLPWSFRPDIQTYFAGASTDGNNVVQMNIETDGVLYAKTLGGEVKGVTFSACFPKNV